jgi:hypothetical protein
MRWVSLLSFAIVALATSLAGSARAFDLLTLDKEAALSSGSDGTALARIRVGADPALRDARDPRCPATTRVRIAAYAGYRFVGEPEVELPCARWSAVPGGFAYHDPSGSAAGVRRVLYGPGGLTIEAATPGATRVAGPVGFVHVRFSVGDAQYFVRFHSFSRNAPDAVVSPRASRAAARGEAAFWGTLLGDAPDGDRALAALGRAVAQDPRDARSLFLEGMLHLYRFERLEPDPRVVSDAGKREILAGAAALERALPRLWDGAVGDGRAPGFVGAVVYKKGVAFGEADVAERGRRLMNAAAEADGLFNGFIPFGFGPIAAPDSADYATILHLLDVVFPSVFDDCATQGEICFNEGLAPHNLEGSFLLFGDLYTKAGRVADAVEAYGIAADAGEASGWNQAFVAHARRLAADAGARAALYADGDPANDPPFTDFGGAGNCAYCHNR